ncbi:MAG: plastocyanin/azurin family copper-binding protein [Verrucomicrobiota bacterium]
MNRRTLAFRIIDRVCLGVLILLALAPSVPGQEATNKTFFLPKSPVAAAYVLGRLSNRELIQAPRGEYVYVALLQRNGLERKYRIEAVEGLAKLRNTDSLTELLGGLAELDKKGEASEATLRDLLSVLLLSKSEDLTAKRGRLEKLATESQLPITRQIAFAALVTSDGSSEQTWTAAESNPAQLSDLLLAVPLLRDVIARASFYPKVVSRLAKPEPAEVRRAAITAVSAIPGHDAETFATLAGLAKSGTERDVAVASLQRIPRNAWPKDQAGSLVESLMSYLQSLPVEQRTEAGALNAFQFATDLTTLLPPESAKTFSRDLRALGVNVFVVHTIPEQMLYDKTLIVVEAGKPVSIVLINDDNMPHNLVVTAPGALEEVGAMAEKMPPEPDLQGRLYIPSLPSVLHATRLVEPGQQAKLSFIAPDALGDYQYVCTFPGHWRRMVGTLAVVNDVEAYVVTHAAAAQPKITEWKLGDLTPELSKLDAGRNLARGKEAFTRLACVSCHQLGPAGASYGPELTEVFARYQNNAAEVLRQILEPSLVISNRYRGFDFELRNGDELSGMIVKEEGEVLTVQSGPVASLVQPLKKSEIKAQKPQKSSLMPLGLLNTLSAEEILDLLAFVKSGGNAPAHQHQH